MSTSLTDLERLVLGIGHESQWNPLTVQEVAQRIEESDWLARERGRDDEARRILNRVAHQHQAKQTWDERDGFVMICDYDKTEWPCRHRRILEGDLA